MNLKPIDKLKQLVSVYIPISNTAYFEDIGISPPFKNNNWSVS